MVVHLATGVLAAFGKCGEDSLVPSRLPAESLCVKCVHPNVGMSGVCVGCSAGPRLGGGQQSYCGEGSLGVSVPGGVGAESMVRRLGMVQVQDCGEAEKDAPVAGY